MGKPRLSQEFPDSSDPPNSAWGAGPHPSGAGLGAAQTAQRPRAGAGVRPGAADPTPRPETPIHAPQSVAAITRSSRVHCHFLFLLKRGESSLHCSCQRARVVQVGDAQTIADCAAARTQHFRA